MDPCFVLDCINHKGGYSIPKSEIHNYGDLLNAVSEATGIDRERMACLRRFVGGTMQVGTEGEITEENGNDWVKECKATVNNTHFRLVCCDDDANSGSEGYNGDSDNSSEED